MVGQTWDVSHHHEKSRRCEEEGYMREVPYSNVCFLKFSLASVWGIDMAEGGRSGGREVCEEIQAMNGWWWAERGVIRPRNREAECQQGVAVNWQQGVREEEERAPSVLSSGRVLSIDGRAWEHRFIHHTVASPLGGGTLPSSPQSQCSPECLSPSRPFVLLVSSS